MRDLFGDIINIDGDESIVDVGNILNDTFIYGFIVSCFIRSYSF